ncbi:MAG: CSLREA domain-containing protein, partial [Chloroflexi bacterium]|nr:CSLREA domain-containing protein [Chloroflexota bacterium]
MIKKSIHLLMLAAMLAGLLSLTPAQPVRAASLVVDTLVDENDGSCVDGDCSLRDAVAFAGGGDVITFSVTGT